MINLLDLESVKKLLSEIEGSENRDRKIQTWGAYNISHGDILPYVREEVKRMLPQSWKQMRIADISLSEKIISKISQSYKEAPIRMIQDNETDSENLSDLYQDIGVNEKMDEFDFIFNLNRYALLWINYKEENGIRFVPLHPFEFDVVRDSDGELQAVVLSYPDSTITHSVNYNNLDNPDGMNQRIASHRADSSEYKEFALWTKDQHILVGRKMTLSDKGSKEAEIIYLDIDGNPNNINPLGILPFVYLSKDDGGNTQDYPVPNPITRQSVFYNVLKSDELSAASLQGYGVRILSGTSEILNNIQKLHEGLTTAIELPQPDDPTQARTELRFERPGPDLEGQRGSYDSYLSQVLSQHGINAGAVLNNQNDNYKSGLDRVIANADVQGIIKQNQNYYARVEQKSFEIVKTWTNLYGDIKFSQESDLQIIYPRPQVLISDKETLENIKMLLELGLIQKHEALMKLNPNLKEEDAIAKVKEIDSEKNEKAKAFLNNGMNNKVPPMIEEDKNGDIENPEDRNRPE